MEICICVASVFWSEVCRFVVFAGCGDSVFIAVYSSVLALFVYNNVCEIIIKSVVPYGPVTNENVSLIQYSVTICEQNTKDCAPSGCFQHKLQS